MNTVNKATIDLIKSFEGFSANAYHDPIDKDVVDTIGYGSILYEDGRKVKVGDPIITEERAVQLLMWEVNLKAKAVSKLISSKLNDNQFGALVSFSYNLGEGNLASSTLLRKVNLNPNDASIQLEFNKWIFANKVAIKGLERRRKAEWALYSSK